MLQIYLPIAEMSVSAVLLLVMGGAVGTLSGMFGIGGGFLLTPLLILVGIPAPIAVGTQANQSVAGALSGMLAHRMKKNVDFRLGGVMLSGSLSGTLIGSLIFGWLERWGQLDFVIDVTYVFFLGLIGMLMLRESARLLWQQRKTGTVLVSKREIPRLLALLPFKMTFEESGMTISALVPLMIGLVTGITTVILGLGGSLLVPAMIYLLALPTTLVAGTSLFQVLFTAMAATAMHAINHQTVDLMLALPLMLGNVMGAQLGSRMAGRLRPEIARFTLAMIVLLVALRLLLGLTLPPALSFNLEVVR